VWRILAPRLTNIGKYDDNAASNIVDNSSDRCSRLKWLQFNSNYIISTTLILIDFVDFHCWISRAPCNIRQI